MSKGNFIQLSVAIFFVVALMHLYRLLTGNISISIGDLILPQWVSLIGLVAAGYLAYAGYKLKK